MTKVVLSLLLSFLYSYAYTQNTEVELQYVEENDSIIFQVKSSAIIPIDVVSKQSAKLDV